MTRTVCPVIVGSRTPARHSAFVGCGTTTHVAGGAGDGMVTAPHLRVAPQSPCSRGKEASSGSLPAMENYRSLGLNAWRLKQILPSFAFFSCARASRITPFSGQVGCDRRTCWTSRSMLKGVFCNCEACFGEDEKGWVLLTQGPA